MPKRLFFITVIMTVAVCLGFSPAAFADNRFLVSPMNQKVILTPGETYTGSFKIINPGSSDESFQYELSIQPLSVGAGYEAIFKNNGDYTLIADWTTVDEPTGIIPPNATKEVSFTVRVPENAPAGGQYMAITVSSANDATETGTINIQSRLSIAHAVYAEVAGATIRRGEITSSNVPGFMFSGNIIGQATIRNDGNVHSDAYYTLQVFPMFSNEELYSNEDSPAVKSILPETTRTHSIAWNDTPFAGIFKVIFTVEFEGVTQQVEKYVIVCPIWLLFGIVFAIVLIIFYLWSKANNRKKLEKTEA